jgi:methylthioribose-1-phosphate isomerase
LAIQSIRWAGDRVLLLDQTRLPTEQVVLHITDYRTLISAIKALKIRGAPALGVASAYAMVLGARELQKGAGRAEFLTQLADIKDEIVAARPTAVNMAWAARRMWQAVSIPGGVEEIVEALTLEAGIILDEDVENNKAMGRHGQTLIPTGATVLTHCNTGSLATAGYGTALGVLRAARERGKEVRVVATETRPLLQGARLTAWELVQDGFDATLITDCAIVGADRIAMNGDVANKIGTYTIAAVARQHNIPFYVTAPTSTIDPVISSGDEIPIEQRSPDEVSSFRGVRTVPEGIRIANPGFDITPAAFVTAIITELGIARAPYDDSLGSMIQQVSRYA